MSIDYELRDFSGHLALLEMWLATSVSGTGGMSSAYRILVRKRTLARTKRNGIITLAFIRERQVVKWLRITLNLWDQLCYYRTMSRIAYCRPSSLRMFRAWCLKYRHRNLTDINKASYLRIVMVIRYLHVTMVELWPIACSLISSANSDKINVIGGTK